MSRTFNAVTALLMVSALTVTSARTTPANEGHHANEMAEIEF